MAKGKTKEQTEIEVKKEFSQVKILVTHAGTHGSFVKGDKPVLEKSIADELERCGYGEIISTATEVGTK